MNFNIQNSIFRAIFGAQKELIGADRGLSEDSRFYVVTKGLLGLIKCSLELNKAYK